MATSTKKIGRKKGGRKQGFYFRKGRGWSVIENGSSRLLLDDNGQPIRSNSPSDKARAKEAYEAYRDQQKQEAATSGLAGDSSPVAAIIAAYLEDVQRTGAVATHTKRADMLFDFSTGYPGSYRKRKS